jgi:hypothetical protein
MGEPQFGMRENKKSVTCGPKWVENGSILLLRKSILLLFARAGLLSKISLFFINNRVLGLIVLYNTVLENSYDNIL